MAPICDTLANNGSFGGAEETNKSEQIMHHP